MLDRVEVEELLTLLIGLSEREREVRRSRKFDELSQQKNALRLGVSAARGRQIERRALARLRAAGRQGPRAAGANRIGRLVVRLRGPT